MKRIELVSGVSVAFVGILIPIDLIIRNHFAQFVWFSSDFWPVFFLLTPSNIAVAIAAILHYRKPTRLRLGILVVGATVNNAVIIIEIYWLLLAFAVLKDPLGPIALILDFGLMVVVVVAGCIAQPIRKEQFNDATATVKVNEKG